MSISKRLDLPAPQRRFLNVETVVGVEGLSRAKLNKLQQTHGLKFYEFSGETFVEESELHAALSRAVKEVRS